MAGGMLVEAEWNTINNILLDLYTINDIEKFSMKIMRVIRMLIPYTKGSLIMLDDDKNIIDNQSFFAEFDEKSQKDYLRKYYDEDYIKYLFDITSDTCVYRDTNILEDSIRTNTVFFTDFLKPTDIFYGCGIIIAKNGRIMALLSLFRNEKSGDFTDKELYILNVLKKHMENMVYNVTQMSRGNAYMKKTLKTFADEYNLTVREKEVLGLINKGYSNQEIADGLIISLSTVKKHIYNLFEKTNVSNRSQLITLFLE